MRSIHLAGDNTGDILQYMTACGRYRIWQDMTGHESRLMQSTYTTTGGETLRQLS